MQCGERPDNAALQAFQIHVPAQVLVFCKISVFQNDMISPTIFILPDRMGSDESKSNYLPDE